MMRAGEWRRGVSDHVLGREWDLDPATVRGLSAEAGRIVARELKDPERVQTDVAVVLLANLERASDAGEYNAVAKLGDVVTRIRDARAPERTQEVAMTEEQARDAYRKLTGKEWGE